MHLGVSGRMKISQHVVQMW